jgi:O-antigen/teichoic acid export membrane protein
MYIPIFLLGYYYGPTNAGVFAFVVRILNLPISFISSNVGRPLLNFYKNDLNLSDRVSFEMKSVFYLRIVSSVFFPLFLFVYFIFDVFFQHEWHSSKWVAVTLVPWIFSLTLSTPFSPIMYAKGKFELSFNIQILLLIIRVLVLIVSGLLFDFYTALIFYSMVSSVMWLIFLNESLNLIFITKDYVKKNVIMNIFAVYYFLVELHRIYLNRKST